MPILNKPLKEDINKKYILHAILFPKNKFTLNNAKIWLKENNYHYIHNRQTKNIYRFRIKNEIKDYKFYTKILPNNIQLIFMYK